MHADMAEALHRHLRPPRSGEPKRCRAVVRIALKMPRAVTGDGSPLAKGPSGSPAT